MASVPQELSHSTSTTASDSSHYPKPCTDSCEEPYVDYTSEWIPERNRYSPYLYKRKSFEHEQEIRVIVDLSEHNELTMIDKGVLLKVDLESLIEKIYIAPLSAGWLKDLVVSIMKKYGIHKTPEPSDLEARPLY